MSSYFVVLFDSSRFEDKKGDTLIGRSKILLRVGALKKKDVIRLSQK